MWQSFVVGRLAYPFWFRRPNIFFNITSPTPGTFIIALHYKGREKAILEMDLKIDDLLEKVSLLPFCDPEPMLTWGQFYSKKTINIYWTWNMFN